MHSSAEWRLHVLGPFRLEHGSDEIRFQRRKVASLLAYLALHPGRHTRDALCTLFWGDYPDAEARRSLRVALTALRAEMGDDVVIADTDAIQLDPVFPLWLDAAEFEDSARRFMAQTVPDLAGAWLDLYQGELLADLHNDWIIPVRERLHTLYIDALLHLTQQLRSQSAYAPAVETARRVLASDPANERAHQHLMFCLTVMGDRAAALRQYDACVRALRDELAAEPLPETTTLYHWIQGRPAHETPSEARITNLPVPVNSFVGRESESGQCLAVLRQPDVRLLTLTGAGGSGKTRLAVHVASALVGEYRHGVFFVDLSALSEPDLLPSAIAATLGVQAGAGRDLAGALLDFLRDKHMLLLLDNFEQIVQAAPLLIQMLRVAPGLKLLVASRTALKVSAEHEFDVPPLQTPDARRLPDLGALSQFEAVRLFIERARAVKPDFQVTNENAPAVAEICARLDGLPLAIELAAARSKVLSPQLMLTHLASRLGLLTSGARDAPARHQTLRAAIAWSYELLSPNQQRLFCQMSVFAGGWTLDAADAVCGGQALDGLCALVDHSLARRQETASGEVRFSMLETIREFALERLDESGEAGAVRMAHATHFLAFAEGTWREIHGAQSQMWLDRWEAEHDNLRSALTWALQTGNAELGLRLGSAMWDFWQTHNYRREALDWYTRLLALPGADAPTALRADVLISAAWAASYMSDRQRANVLGAEALSLARRVGDTWCLARALRQRSGYEPPETGREMLKESAALCRTINHGLGIAMALNELADIALTVDVDAAAALALRQEALALARANGAKSLICGTLMAIADVVRLQDGPAAARPLLEEAKAHAEDLGDRNALAQTIVSLGSLASDQRQRARSFEEALAIFRDLGQRDTVAFVLAATGEAYGLAGDLDKAESCVKQSLALGKEIGNTSAQAQANLASALLANLRRDDAAVLRAVHTVLRLTEQGAAHTWYSFWSAQELAQQAVAAADWPRAAWLLGAVAGHLSAVRVTSVETEYPRCAGGLASLREHMGDAAVSAAWAEGQAMTIRQAGLRALAELDGRFPEDASSQGVL